MSETPDSRFLAFDRAADQLRSLALQEPLALLLDDLHAADVPSLLFLQFVARMLRNGSRIGIVATYRDAEARLDGEVGTLLTKVARDGETLAPSRLTCGEIADWILHEKPDTPEGVIQRVQEIHIFRMANGKIVEHWAGRDDIGRLRQLGHLGNLTGS